MVEPTQFQSSDTYDVLASDSLRSESSEDWTLLREFWNFREPQNSREITGSRPDKSDVEDDGYCSIRPVAEDGDKDPMLCADSRSIHQSSSISAPTSTAAASTQETRGDIRPLPSITTLVRGASESTLYAPPLEKGNYLQIPGRGDPVPSFSKECNFVENERNTFMSDLSIDNNLSLSKTASDLERSDISNETVLSRNYAAVTPAPVDLSSLSSSKGYMRPDDYRMSYRESRPTYLEYRSPQGGDPGTPEFTPEYAHDYSTSQYDKLLLLRSSVDLSDDPLKIDGDYKKDNSADLEAPYSNFKHLSILPKESETASASGTQLPLSVPSNSSFGSAASPCVSPDPPGEASPRPPVSLLRDLLVLGKPGRSPPPPSQHDQ
ncbi:hypothetical protein FHG87_005929, partial [Trinorchestia longiramus]